MLLYMRCVKLVSPNSEKATLSYIEILQSLDASNNEHCTVPKILRRIESEAVIIVLIVDQLACTKTLNRRSILIDVFNYRML